MTVNAPAHHQPSKKLKIAGLLLFLLGLTIFTISIGIGEYRIDGNTLAAAADKGLS